MVRVFLLLIASLAWFVWMHSGGSDGCSNTESAYGLCSVDASVGAGQVTLQGSASSGGGSGSSAGGTTGQQIGRGKASAPKDPNDCGPRFQFDNQGTIYCRGQLTKRATASPAPTTAASRPVTLRDVASFRPAPGTQQMEPDGWVVAGLDANLFALVDQQLVPGTLFGQAATVRFTPIRYHWDYGDGATAAPTTKGGTWASQGRAEFDRTPTSHVYAVEGDYVIRLSIDFRAEYRFGSSSFTPIAGTITLPANDLRVTVTGAKTVLVDRDCVANPSGPGC